jgi:thiol-disulfide isomerase/thioredoxin
MPNPVSYLKVALGLVLVAGGLGACSRPAAPVPETNGPFLACNVPPPESRSIGEGLATGPNMNRITLPCFNGGAAVNLSGLGRPAVLNLWASWCGPCRTELPVFQQYADSGPPVTVLGVVTGDTRTAAASFAEDVHVTFPAVFDHDAKVQRSGLVPVVLPVTIFVDALGQVRHVESAPVPNVSTLDSLVKRYLGVPS